MTTPRFLVRRSFDEGGCSMKITEDVRKYATEQGLRMIATAVPETKGLARELWQEAKELHLIFAAICRGGKD